MNIMADHKANECGVDKNMTFIYLGRVAISAPIVILSYIMYGAMT